MLYPRLVRTFTQSTPISCTIDADGIDEDGAPIEGVSWSGKANLQDNTREVYASGKAETEVLATLYIDGDPFPEMAHISGGEVELFGEQRTIVQGSKNRNPDSTVNFVRLDLR